MSEIVSILRPQDVGIGLLFERIREGVIVADVESGRIVLWNPGAARIFGYAADEAVGLSLEALIPAPASPAPGRLHPVPHHWSWRLHRLR